MGIPSYYRLLCQKNKKTIKDTYERLGKVILCLDFNCIVYYCLSKIPEFNDTTSYEASLIN